MELFREGSLLKPPKEKKKTAARSSPMPDYRSYTMNGKETAAAVLIYLAAAGAVLFLFYNRLYLMPLALPGLIPWIRHCSAKKAEDRRKKLSYDFREALDSLSVSIKAGYSVENAFPAAARDLASILGKDADMTRELRYIAQQSRLSVPVESLLLDFAARSGLEDIRNFAAVFAAAKRMGGNMPGIIRSAADAIGGRIDVSREIETALASKQLEQKIMGIMPCGILLYMRFASPGFLDIMYTTVFGAAIMTACLAAYAAAVMWGRKIVAIEV